MGILDFMFGKKIVKKDDFFGRIESSKIFKKDFLKKLTWYANYKFKNYTKKTLIIIDGNQQGPNPNQKKVVTNFILNFEKFYSPEIDNFVNSDDEYTKFKNWKSEYFISCICPLVKSELGYEINFEAIDDGNKVCTLILI